MSSPERRVTLYVTLVLLGASLELISMLSGLQDVAGQILTRQQTLLWLLPTDITSAVVWFLVPAIFCCTASLLAFTDRKRIVSPVYVQMVTFVASEFVIIAVALDARFTQPSVYGYLSFSWMNLLGFSLSWVGIFVVALGIGACQLIVVRWFVGLEMPEPLDRATYSIPRPFALVRETINDTFLLSQELTIVRDDEALGILVLLRWSLAKAGPLFGSGQYVVVAFGPNPETKDGTLLATVAFERDFYEMRPSRYARAIRDTIVGDLERRLNEHRPFDPATVDNTISGIAYMTALEPSYSKLRRTKLAFRDVPTSFRTMIMVTIFFMLAVFIFYATGFEGFNFSAFIETFALALFALMVEMGIALREEITERMRRRLGSR